MRLLVQQVQIVIQPFPLIVGDGVFPEYLTAAANVKAGDDFAVASVARVDGLVERKRGAMSDERCRDDRHRWQRRR